MQRGLHVKKIRLKLHLISTCKSTPIIHIKKSTWNTPGFLMEHVSTNFLPQLHVESTWCVCWDVIPIMEITTHTVGLRIKTHEGFC